MDGSLIDQFRELSPKCIKDIFEKEKGIKHVPTC